MNNFKIIESTVCEALGVTPDALRSKCRKRELAECRFWIWYFSRMYTRMSLIKMGAEYQRDHSTVIYGLSVIDALRSHNGYEANYADLHKRIKFNMANINIDDFACHIANAYN